MSLQEEDLRRRLADLAESTDPWADPLPAVMQQAHAEPHRQRRLLGPRVVRWSFATVAVAALVVGAILAVRTGNQDVASSERTGSNEAERVIVRSALPLVPGPQSRATTNLVPQAAGPNCATVAKIPLSRESSVPWASVDATVHVASGMQLNARIRVSSALPAASRATVDVLIVSGDGVIAQLAVSPVQLAVPAHSIVTFDASGPLTCAADGSPVPPGQYGLVAVVTTRQPLPPGYANTVLSPPVIVDVSGPARS